MKLHFNKLTQVLNYMLFIIRTICNYNIIIRYRILNCYAHSIQINKKIYYYYFIGFITLKIPPNTMTKIKVYNT